MEKVLINSQEIIDFLDDVKQNSKTEILEEGKEKNELIQIAKKHGIDLKDNPDLAGFKNIYAPTGKANLNKCRLIKEIIVKRLHTLNGKPIDIDHERDYVTGHYLEAKMVKDDIVSYGLFYKSNFADEYEHAKALFKKGKLTTSFEIWCPKEKRINHKDGTYSLADENLHLAGGGILFKTKPAFPEARVLQLAKKQCKGKHCDMVFASSNVGFSSKDLITSSIEIIEPKVIIETKETWICPHCDKEIGKRELYIGNDNTVIHKPCNNEVILPKLEKSEVETIKKPGEKTGIKTTCQNCNYMFEWDKVLEYKPNVKKCPKCQAVINTEGKVLQIPQRIDFRIGCPECNSSMSWEILERSEEKVKVRCSSCNKAYELTFNKKEDPFVSKFFKLTRYFNYITEKMKGCKQCRHKTEITNVDFDKNELGVKCANCGLQYRINYLKPKNKRIIEIKEIELSYEKIDNNLIQDITNELEKRREIFMSEGFNFEDLELSGFSTEELNDLQELLVSDINDEGIEEGKRLTYKERQKLPDDMFAVVKTVKTKRGTTKIRMFPIHDEAHVRNALARLGQPKTQATLKRLGVSIESVKKKILGRAKKLNMKELLKRYKGFEEITNKEEDIMSQETKTPEQIKAEKDALAKRAKAVGLKEDVSKEEIEKAEKAKAEQARNAKLAERAKSVGLKEDATEKEIVEAEKIKAEEAKKKAKDDELIKLKKENDVLKKTIETKDAEIKKLSESHKNEIEKVRSDTAKLTARKIKLGEEKTKNMKDEDILNDDKFKSATLEVENAKLKEEAKNGGKLPTGHKAEGEENEKDCLEVAGEYVDTLAYGNEKENKE